MDGDESAEDCVEADAEAMEEYEARPQLLCESAATLIVTPTNILHQWKNEILRHSPNLSVCIYLGMRAWNKESRRMKRIKEQKAKRKFSDLFPSDNGVRTSQPRKRRRLNSNRSESIIDRNDSADEQLEEPNYRNLGKYDVVLTDYSVLKAESDFSNPLKYSFRRKKRHQIPDTPLLQIRWWRLILDEAQQIESRVSKCAQMALKVSCKHKWCVTGTPIGKNGLDDLFGLIKFLGIRPFNSPITWLRTVAEPYYNGDDRKLFSILQRIMWRQAKHHVAKELNIPPRSEEFIELTFGGVEHEYYKKLHDEFTEELKNESRSQSTANGTIQQKLEVLRKACCHPQISRIDGANGGLLTMEQIMAQMIADAKDRKGADERDLSRAGTYYSDWLIYRMEHRLFDDAQRSELELALNAMNVLEEVYKVEQSGIDHVSTETVISEMKDESIRCDADDDAVEIDISSMPQIAVNLSDCDDEKLKLMMNDLNESSLSPVVPLKVNKLSLIESDSDVIVAEEMKESDDRFALNPKSSLESLQQLQVNDRVAVYMLNRWQPAQIIGVAANQIIVHFANFNRPHCDSMDRLIDLDPNIISTENYNFALKQSQQQIAKVNEGKNEQKQEERNAASEINISEKNETYYQWKKCEIATAHHLKYLYQRLLADPRKFRLSARDIDILHKKVAVMAASFKECKHELQEMAQLKVAEYAQIIEQYEAQIDEWSKELKIAEIDKLVAIRKKLPIEQWTKKQFKKVHSFYDAFKKKMDEIERKLQYSCFKQRIEKMRAKQSIWGPKFCAIWDGINEEFRHKMSSKQRGGGVMRARWNLSDYLKNAMNNLQRRMNEIERNYRGDADAVNERLKSDEIGDLVCDYRAKWNDLSDITTLFRVFIQIHGDHKKLKKAREDLADNEQKLATHCAIVNDFDVARWTVVGIEDHLRNRYEVWKQKALGKSQQLRYLEQKHQLLMNCGCRVDEECSICQQKMSDPVLTPCGHLFCEDCILAWLQSVNQRSHSKACPECRQRVRASEIFHVSQYLTQSQSSHLHSSIDSVFGQKERERKSGSHIDEIEIVGKGDYGTKIEALVKYICYLAVSEPHAKSLVYSQFNQLLSIIAALLHQNGISAIHQSANCKLSKREKAKRIEKFQTDESVKVLLLSLRTDSSGLTLIQSTHVFLLEPSLNEAIELQAIDRVHRVGQSRPTFVHRYFVKGTVEESVLRRRYDRICSQKKKKNSAQSGLDKGQNKEEMTMAELQKLFE